MLTGLVDSCFILLSTFFFMGFRFVFVTPDDKVQESRKHILNERWRWFESVNNVISSRWMMAFQFIHSAPHGCISLHHGRCDSDGVRIDWTIHLMTALASTISPSSPATISSFEQKNHHFLSSESSFSNEISWLNIKLTFFHVWKSLSSLMFPKPYIASFVVPFLKRIGAISISLMSFVLPK